MDKIDRLESDLDEARTAVREHRFSGVAEYPGDSRQADGQTAVVSVFLPAVGDVDDEPRTAVRAPEDEGPEGQPRSHADDDLRLALE
jgi:hypothetical protein